MARLARIVVPHQPHLVTQWGNRRQRVFFRDRDRRLYLDLLAEFGRALGLRPWAYCLMDDHVHLLAVPETESALARAVGEVHRRYTRAVNRRQGWRGFLWQGRFASCPIQDRDAPAAARFVELNPVRRGLVTDPQAYRWSSARAHVRQLSGGLLDDQRLSLLVDDWKTFLGEGCSDAEAGLLRRHCRTGRPIGDEAFIIRLEQRLGRRLRKGKPGPKPAAEGMKRVRSA
jgi:putative transposase